MPRPLRDSPHRMMHLPRLAVVMVLLVSLLMAALPAASVAAATVTVTTTADGVHNPGCATDGITAPCTLRDAVIYANGSAGPTTITLAAGIYTLTIGPSGNDDATTGDLNLTANIIINGAGAGTTFIDASGMSPGDRVMKVGVFGIAGRP